MEKEKLIKTIQRLLQTDTSLGFLKKLSEHELEALVACIREKIDRKV